MKNEKKKGLSAARKENISGWLMIAVPIIGFLLFQMIPMLISAGLSFTELKSYRIELARFIGFSNFKTIFTDPLFYKSLGNTFYYCVAIIGCMGLGLIIALLLFSKWLRGRRIFRTMFFLPYVCSVVAVSVMWLWIYEPNYGILNSLLKALGIHPIAWLKNPATFMPCVIVMQLWSGTGFNLILYQAAISKVDQSYYEAAELDGASAWQKFAHITWPAISPTTFYLLVVGLISGLQAFTQIQIIANNSAGPDNAGLTIVYYLYKMAFENVTSYGFGIASAMAWIVALIVIVITFINFKLQKLWAKYD